MKKNRKTAALLFSAFFMALSLFSCHEKQEPAKAGELKVTFFDVGKADAILLQSETANVVIDCGEKGDGKKISKLLEASDADTIDYLIITHFDKDHVGGAAKLIRGFDVKNVLTPDYDGTVEEYDKYKSALAEKSITPMKLTEDVSFTLDGIDYTVYAPKKTFYGEDDENDFSLVTKVVHNKNTLLFTGDAMEQRLDEIMDIGTCTLLKVPYHGRKLDNITDFLSAVKPKCAVVCTSIGEFSGKVQDALKKSGATTYATCFNGDITAVSNGTTIEMSVEQGSALY
ncbi:MAG: MBL fold metallo-hydrolase [Ruminococcus sp.]|uniref:ComEC/Rec2 family competence protein n=1 Tax=Ruminococcus sp. TaxID=41978 RepID=UPI001AFE2774|nr:MBL fold metallo-hydrolase [Ruminococcus sp.]MBO7474939.1 MBL fold metallo-hydrolase [Ruminococcus sp.]